MKKCLLTIAIVLHSLSCLDAQNLRLSDISYGLNLTDKIEYEQFRSHRSYETGLGHSISFNVSRVKYDQFLSFGADYYSGLTTSSQWSMGGGGYYKRSAKSVDLRMGLLPLHVNPKEGKFHLLLGINAIVYSLSKVDGYSYFGNHRDGFSSITFEETYSKFFAGFNLSGSIRYDIYQEREIKLYLQYSYKARFAEYSTLFFHLISLGYYI